MTVLEIVGRMDLMDATEATQIVERTGDGKTRIVARFNLAAAEVFEGNGDDRGSDITAVAITTRQRLVVRRGGLWERGNDAEAREWLLRHGYDEAVDRVPVTSKRGSGAGRPAIGPPINVRLGELERVVELLAKQDGVKKPEEIRRLIALGIEQRRKQNTKGS